MEYIIHVPEYAAESLIEFSDESRQILQDYIKREENAHGFDLSRNGSYINCYDFDEYLYIASIVQSICNQYTSRYYNARTGEWIRGASPLPYIHVELVESNALNPDGTVNAKKLILQVCPPDERGNYTIQFDRYYLFQYIQYLQLLFDKNAEEVIPLTGQLAALGERFRREGKISKGAFLEKIRDYTEPVRTIYADVAEAMEEDETMYFPIVRFDADPETGREVFGGLIFYDEARGVLTTPLKKQIFSTQGFFKFFSRRNMLIQELFEKTMYMLLAHEVAHVANGHFLLQAQDLAYVRNKDVAVCMEQNADDTAIRWLIGQTIYETVDGDPISPVLRFTEKELVQEWVMLIFAAYLGLSWIYRDGERIWDAGTLDQYMQDTDTRHPIYQFRTYNVVNRGINLVYELVKINDQAEAAGISATCTADGVPLNRQMAQAAYRQLMDMLDSFEYAIAETYHETRSMEQIRRESWQVERQSRPDSPQALPFLMPLFFPEAGEQAEQIRRRWPQVRQRLLDAGAFANLFETI